MTVKQLVLENKKLLETLKTHTQLRDWAIEHKLDNSIDFSNFGGV